MSERKRGQRRSIRWAGRDYAQAGWYFVTICTADRQNPLGRIEGAEMRLSQMGQVAEGCWQAIPDHFAGVALDAFIVMPNHVHGIIVISDEGARHASPVPGDAEGAAERDEAARAKGAPARSLGAIVGSYKAAVCRRIHEIGAVAGRSVWHRNYYEHVIRNARQLQRIRQYIAANPANWAVDRENPEARSF